MQASVSERGVLVRGALLSTDICLPLARVSTYQNASLPPGTSDGLGRILGPSTLVECDS